MELPLSPPKPLETESSSASTIQELIDWRIKDRLRTVSAGLILCLHLGVDPPDILKPSPCARWECWIDPINGETVRKVGCPNDDDDDSDGTLMCTLCVQCIIGICLGKHLTLHLKSSNTTTITTNTTSTSTSASASTTEKVREAIARNLLIQYENWQPRVRYKTLLDPTVEELRKLCSSLRKSAKSERVLFHYNGHGVPRPTRNGEFWVFNKQFTQYIPVNVTDVVGWLGCPTIWILDCPAAGFLSNSLQKAVSSYGTGNGNSATKTTSSISSDSTIISTFTTLNTSPATTNTESIQPNTLNLILFSACDSHETLPFTPSLPADILTSCLTTPLDMAIRWHCHLGGPLLPQSLTVESALKIPGKLSDRRTPLGELNWIFTAITDTIAWLVLPRDLFRRLYRQDLLVASLSRNYLLAQRILKSLYCTSSAYPPLPPTHQHNLWNLWDHALDTLLAQLQGNVTSKVHQSTFFPDQLDAFELWLRQHRNLPATQIIGPPDQLPAALQVLLSQNLRPRALKLFAEFCDFGPWACLECLHVGIHPYILKLIGSSASSTSTNSQQNDAVTQSLLRIWTKMMIVDPSCKADLLKDSTFMYFFNFFPVEPELATMALTAFSLENPQGRAALLSQESFKSLLSNEVDEDCSLWRILLGALFPEVFNGSFEDKINYLSITSDIPKIRTASLLALNLNSPQAREILCKALQDQSPLVRLELAHLTCDGNSLFSDLFESLKRDPFPPISTRNYLTEKSNFIAHCLNDSFDSSNQQSSSKQDHAKYQALNQLEVDSWLERPAALRKFDSQLAVLEFDCKIDKILLHPQKSEIFILDFKGNLKRWNWETQSDDFQLPRISLITNSDFLIPRNDLFLISCTSKGIVNIYSSSFETGDLPLKSFSCHDLNVKLIELKNGQIVLAGDEKVTIYDVKSDKFRIKTRPHPNLTVTNLLEIDSGIILSTTSNSIEFYGEDEGITLNVKAEEEIAHLWRLNNSTNSFNFVTLDGLINQYCYEDENSHISNLGSGITCITHHPLLPRLIAYGSSTDHCIKIAEFVEDDDYIHLQSIKYHEGFLGHRLGHINSISWHPSRLILGAVASETFVSIYGIKDDI